MVRLLACSLFVVLLLATRSRAEEPKVFGKTSPEWRQILEKDEREKYRRAAVAALEAFGAGERGVVDALILALRKDKSPVVRQAAAQTLGRMGGDAKSAVEPLGTVLAQDKTAAVREAAAKALGGAMVPHSKVALVVLAAALQDADVGTRAAAAATLKDLGEESRGVLPQMLAAVKDVKQDKFTRMYLAQALGSFRKEAAQVVPVLTALLQEEQADATLQQVVVDGLAHFGKDAAPAIAPLLHIFQDKKAPVLLRRSAAVTLVQLEPASTQVWPAVQAGLKDTNQAIRSEAVRLGSKVCPSVPELVPELLRLTRDKHIEVQLAAIQELGELGPTARAAAAALEQIARTGPRASLREAAAAALKKIRGEVSQE